jgi:hypothetical protein
LKKRYKQYVLFIWEIISMPVRKVSKPSSPVAKAASTPKAATPAAAEVATPAAAAEVATPAAAATPAPASGDTKTKKPKLVRDSFTVPKDEYAAIEGLKLRAAQQGHVVKKSELLRAGLKLLSGLDEQQLLAALKAVPSIKTGRPAKAQELPAGDRTPERAPAKSRKTAKAA